jgi:uncharacterized protein YndB with AHSA1/START domain
MVTVTDSRKATVTLPTDEQILITREFDAPRHLVYKAWTTPELVKRWWSGHRGEVTTAEIDLRVGGRWRYVMVADGGFEVGFHGEYREIVPDERIVNTEVYELPEASEDDRREQREVLALKWSVHARFIIAASAVEPVGAGALPERLGNGGKLGVGQARGRSRRAGAAQRVPPAGAPERASGRRLAGDTELVSDLGLRAAGSIQLAGMKRSNAWRSRSPRALRR